MLVKFDANYSKIISANCVSYSLYWIYHAAQKVSPFLQMSGNLNIYVVERLVWRNASFFVVREAILLIKKNIWQNFTKFWFIIDGRNFYCENSFPFTQPSVYFQLLLQKYLQFNNVTVLYVYNLNVYMCCVLLKLTWRELILTDAGWSILVVQGNTTLAGTLDIL